MIFGDCIWVLLRLILPNIHLVGRVDLLSHCNGQSGTKLRTKWIRNHLAQWFMTVRILCAVSMFALHRLRILTNKKWRRRSVSRSEEMEKFKAFAPVLWVDGHATIAHRYAQRDECRWSHQRAAITKQLAHNQRDGTAPSNSSRLSSSGSSQQHPRNDCSTRRKTPKAEKRENEIGQVITFNLSVQCV